MKGQVLAIFSIILITTSLRGQSNEEFKKLKTGNWLELSVQAMDSEGDVIPFEKVGQLPEFPGGYDSLASFVFQFLEYPESAIEDSVEGRVLTTFIIDSTGQVVDVKIVSGVRSDLDSVCLYGIKQIPDWQPGLSWNGEPVSFKVGLPIRFVLKEEEH